MIASLANPTAAISRRFGAASATYNQHACVHEQIAEDLLVHLDLEQPLHILDVGAGTGILSAKVINKFPEANLTAQDLSLELLEVNKSAHPKIECLLGDFNELKLTQDYDAIVSSAALHWLNDPAAAIAKMETALTPNGKLAFAVMTSGTFPELDEARRQACNKASRTQLKEASYWTQLNPNFESERKAYRAKFDSAESFLRVLHEMGVTGSLNEASPLTRGELKSLCSYYNEHFIEGDKVIATYEVLHLWMK